MHEFYRMYRGMEPASHHARHHIYRFVPLEFRRNVRLLSTIGMLNIYILFIFGVVKVIKLDMTWSDLKLKQTRLTVYYR